MIQWNREGDANTKYFHAVMKSKKAALTIDTIIDSTGNIISSQPCFHVASIANFHSHLMSATHTLDNALLDLIPELVSDEENRMLMSPFTIKEAKMAVLASLLDSAGV